MTGMSQGRASWLPGVRSDRDGLLSPSRHELPRWRSPSPMLASMIPPPIVQSTYVTAPRDASTSPTMAHRPRVKESRESQIEAELQFLLDAQAEALMKDFEEERLQDQVSTRSTTPTISSVRSLSNPRPVRLRGKPPSLKRSRKGIHRLIVTLASVKDDELHLADEDLVRSDQTLERIRHWEDKRRRLEEAPRRVSEEDDAVNLAKVQHEADALQDEINEAEQRLDEMKSRHRKLMREATTINNSIQAKLASYKSSLRMLEADVQRFLESDLGPAAPRRSLENTGESILDLPPRRRTLRLAKAHLTEERNGIVQHMDIIQHEKRALKDGAVMWKEVVAQVTDFERQLASEMRMQSAASTAVANTSLKLRAADSTVRLKALLEKMGDVIAGLDNKIEIAGERRWNLLIAAMGAELDALKRGEEILERLAHGSDHKSGENADSEIHTNEDPSDDIQTDASPNLDRSSGTTARRRHGSDELDSEGHPDPELLFSTDPE